MKDKNIIYFEYARKSTEGDKRQVLSIDGQLQDIKQIVEREGLVVKGQYIDKKSAAIPFNRPGYSEMIDRIKKGEANGIVVWHIDRLVRNHLEAGEFQYLLQTGAIKSIWTNAKEYRSEDNGIVISLEASIATQYSRDLAERVTKGLAKKCAMGQPPGIAKHGYLNTKYAAHGTNSIIEDPDRWPLLRMAFDMLLSLKYNTPEIVNILNTKYGFTTRRIGERGNCPLHRSVLYRVFTDPFYAGRFWYKGKLFKGSYKPMISLEEFDRVQEILGRKDRTKSKNHNFAFTGFIKCGSCGCSITASRKTKKAKTTGETKVYTFYHCTKRKGKEVCTEKHYTTEKEMESMIEEALQSYSLSPLFKDWAIETVRSDIENILLQKKEIIDQLNRNEQKVLRELDTILDLRISSEISEEKYIQKKNEKEGILFRIQEQKDSIENDNDYSLDKLIDKLDFAVSAIEQFKKGDFREKKRICETFGWNWVLKGKKLEITRFEWFVFIKEYHTLLSTYFDPLEPKNTFEKYRQSDHFEGARLILRRLYNLIRKNLNNENSVACKT